jgi:transposase
MRAIFGSVSGGEGESVMRRYSENFKRKMVQRMSGPQGRSAVSLAKETGVARWTLSRWLQEARTIDLVTDDDRDSKPESQAAQERSAEEKLRLVLEAGRLTGEELGAFLRREGLHEAELDQWRDAMISSLRPSKQSLRESRRIRELEKELRRKDKALAEAAALLVLQKKVQALWGDEDDDTNKPSDE